LLVEGSIPSGLVSQTQGGHDEYQRDADERSVDRFWSLHLQLTHAI
jgi:hypothetical protein